MMALIGFFVGLLGSTLKLLIEHIVESKIHYITHLLHEGAFALMWLVAILISMSLALASAVVVVYGEPAAGGSGIPDVMAYLNGVSIRKIFGAKALVVKFFSCIFAVSAGLYGGQEGMCVGGREGGRVGWEGIGRVKLTISKNQREHWPSFSPLLLFTLISTCRWPRHSITHITLSLPHHRSHDSHGCSHGQNPLSRSYLLQQT